MPPAARINPTSGGDARLRQLAREHGHQIGGLTPMAPDAAQPCDDGLVLEMLTVATLVVPSLALARRQVISGRALSRDR